MSNFCLPLEGKVARRNDVTDEVLKAESKEEI